FFFSSRRRHTRWPRDWSSDVCSSDLQQGASTITEQFVKNALEAQSNRTVFEKLREAALAYHLEHRWPKQKILDNYLNTIYFGNRSEERRVGKECRERVWTGD